MKANQYLIRVNEMYRAELSTLLVYLVPAHYEFDCDIARNKIQKEASSDNFLQYNEITVEGEPALNKFVNFLFNPLNQRNNINRKNRTYDFQTKEHREQSLPLILFHPEVKDQLRAVDLNIECVTDQYVQNFLLDNKEKLEKLSTKISEKQAETITGFVSLFIQIVLNKVIREIRQLQGTSHSRLTTALPNHIAN